MLPPVGCTGVEMVANEMEGEAAMAGIKEGAKWTPVDFRNPCVSIDFGTTLDGRITSDVDESAESPFAKTIGNFAGLAGAIPDAIVRGTGTVQQRTGTVLDLFSDRSTLGNVMSRTNRGVVDDYVERCHAEIDIRIVPSDRYCFGRVPLCAAVAEASGIALIGCDAGVNGSSVPALEAIGRECHKEHGIATLTEVVDRVCTRMALRMIAPRRTHRARPNASIGFTGRAAIWPKTRVHPRGDRGHGPLPRRRERPPGLRGRRARARRGPDGSVYALARQAEAPARRAAGRAVHHG